VGILWDIIDCILGVRMTKLAIDKIVEYPAYDRIESAPHPWGLPWAVRVDVPDWSGPIIIEVGVSEIDDNGHIVGSFNAIMTDDLYDRLFYFDVNKRILERCGYKRD
jgi:hypothetical protein